MPVVKANAALIAAVVQAFINLLLAFGWKINVDQLGTVNVLVAAVLGALIHWSAVNDVKAGRRNGDTTSGPFITPTSPPPAPPPPPSTPTAPVG